MVSEVLALKRERESLGSVHFLMARNRRQEEGTETRRLPAVESLSPIFSRASSILVGAAHIRWEKGSPTLLISLETPQTPFEAHFPNLVGSRQFKLTVTTNHHTIRSREGKDRDHVLSTLASDLLRRSQKKPAWAVFF